MVKKLMSVFAAITLLFSVFTPVNSLAYDTDISYLPNPTEIFTDDSFDSENDARKNVDTASAAKLTYVSSGTVSGGTVTLPGWKTLVFAKNSIIAETDILTASIDVTTEAGSSGYLSIRVNGQHVAFLHREAGKATAGLYIYPGKTKTWVKNVLCDGSALKKLSVVLKRTKTESGYNVNLQRGGRLMRGMLLTYITA